MECKYWHQDEEVAQVALQDNCLFRLTSSTKIEQKNSYFHRGGKITYVRAM